MKSKTESGAHWSAGPGVVALGLAALAGCQPIELPGRDAMIPDNIVVLPATTKLTFKGSTIQKVQYTACVASTVDAGVPAVDAKSKCADGMTDVTHKVEWVVEEPTMGSFDETIKGKFTTQVLEKGKKVPAYGGGKTRILAKIAGITGSANLEVMRINTFYAGKANSSAASKFSATAKSGSMTMRYPPNKVLVPPNLGQLELQYTSSRKNDLYYILITSTYSQIRIFTTDANFHNLDVKQWPSVGQTNKGQMVKIRIYGTTAAKPTYQSHSPTYYMYIAEHEIRGGLYYWDTSEPVGIYRYDFEKPTSTAEAYYTSKQAGDCIGCHALSRGGELVAFTKTGGSGMTDIFDVKQRTSIVKPAGKYRGDIQTFGPNGKEIIVVHKGVLRRRDVNTGAILENIPTSSFKSCKTTKDCTKAGESCIGHCSKRTQVCNSDKACPTGEKCQKHSCRTGLATHPDWSADGNMLAYVHVPYSYYHMHDNGYKVPDDVHFERGSIYLIKKNKQGQWTAPRALVTGGKGINYYYPTFSPNGEWIAFNRSSGDSYSDEDATVYVVSPTYDPKKPDKKKLIKLNATVNPNNQSNSWPRWSPFVQNYKGNTLYWLTFSSLRDYGLRLKNSKPGMKYKDKAPQIWMVPFDTTRAAKGQDPNPHPVFWLPFQNVKHHNHIAQWTQKVVAVQ